MRFEKFKTKILLYFLNNNIGQVRQDFVLDKTCMVNTTRWVNFDLLDLDFVVLYEQYDIFVEL